MSNVPNSLDDFTDRFEALQAEATKYGISTHVLLMDDDPISQSTGYISLYEGNVYTLLGGLQCARHQLLKMAAVGE